jgi:multidrug efflux pump
VRRFNLSEWALANRPLVLFAMLAFALIGAWSYKHLGQSEDPPFTFKAMVVRTLWPGATAEQVSRQVTEPIEKALMNTGEYEFIRSYSRPGESQVIFMARDSLRSRQIPTCGTRCASAWATSVRRCRARSSVRSSTMSSATPTATSMR